MDPRQVVMMKTPATGFNLVGLDAQEVPGSGDELYTLGHFETKEEAEAAKAAAEAAPDYNGDELMVYGPA